MEEESMGAKLRLVKWHRNLENQVSREKEGKKK